MLADDRAAGGGWPISPAKWQATLWRGPICSSGGSTLAQISCAIGQRVRNRQPDGGLIGLGTSPSSRIRSRRPPMAACFTSGTAESSAWVYGWCGVVVERLAVGDLDDLAEVHHRDLGAEVPDDREVVGDEQEGDVELASAGPAAG